MKETVLRAHFSVNVKCISRSFLFFLLMMVQSVTGYSYTHEVAENVSVLEKPDASINDEALENLNATEDNDGEYTYYWDFGDGNFSDQETPQHEYAEPGIYTASYSVFKDNYLVSFSSKEVDLVTPLIHSLTIESEIDGLDTSLTLKEEFEQALNLEYRWELSTGDTFEGNDITYRFEEAGTFEVIVIAKFGAQAVYETSKTLTVEPKDLPVDIGSDTGMAPPPSKPKKGGGAPDLSFIVILLLLPLFQWARINIGNNNRNNSNNKRNNSFDVDF